jgi:hypothetical protein
MRHRQYTLTPRHVHGRATHLIQKHVRLRDHGPKTRACVLWTVLFYAASRITSLAAACATLREAPPTLPPTTPSWPPCPTPPSYNAASTGPCKATYPAPCDDDANRWRST